MSGDAMIVWSVRIALLLYIAASITRLVRGPGRMTRLLWTTALFFYLAHVVSAFRWAHGFSHERAAFETARRTEELVGIRSAFGLWLNYLFTAVWTADVFWWWANEKSYFRRPRWISVLTHSFLAFLFFNGAVVFAEGFSRWVGLAATPVLLLLLVWRRLRSEVSGIATHATRSTKKL